MLVILTVLLGMIFGLGLFSIWRLAEVNDASREIREQWLASISVLGDLNNFTSDYPALESSHLFQTSPAEMARIEKDLENLQKTIGEGILRYQQQRHTPEENEYWQSFLNSWKQYQTLSSRVISLSHIGDKKSATKLFLNQSKNAYAMASDILGILTAQASAGARTASQRAEIIYQQTRALIIVAVVLSGFSILLISHYVKRLISGPILTLAGQMHRLASNQLEEVISGTHRRDEIGEMARAVKIFQKAAIELTHMRQGLEKQAGLLSERLEIEKKLTAQQRNFVAMVSHEFRTPLAVIDGQAQRMSKANLPLNPDLSERIGRIRSSVLRLTQLIDTLLTSSRLLDEKAELYFHPVNFDIGSMLHDLCHTYREIAPGSNIIESLRSLPKNYVGDPGLLHQVFSNLLSNAIKYSEMGNPIHLHGKMDNDTLCIAITDQGLGIPEKDIPHLFERFHRGGNVTNMAGAGIGLYLVHTVVEMHHGKIQVESTLGKGSTFSVLLPLKAETATLQQA
jgi:signal transduction histidine kinase